MQLYVQIEKAPFRVPLYDLKNFQRLSFNAIETKTATARIPVSELASINEKGEKVLLKGNYKLFWGTSLPTERSKALGAGNWKEITITLK